MRPDAWPPRRIVGWLAVGLSTAAASFWAWWGAIEAFHEGWYYPDLFRNVALTLVQYVGWMFVPMIAGLLGVWRSWAGSLAHAAFGVGALLLFGGASAGAHLLAIPLFTLAVLYAFGRPAPRRLAARYLVLVPVSCALVAGAYPGWRVLTRPGGCRHLNAGDRREWCQPGLGSGRAGVGRRRLCMERGTATVRSSQREWGGLDA